MFDAKEELKKWKKELITRLHELYSKQELLGGDLETRRKLDDEITAVCFRKIVVDRELQMYGGDQDGN